MASFVFYFLLFFVLSVIFYFPVYVFHLSPSFLNLAHLLFLPASLLPMYFLTPLFLSFSYAVSSFLCLVPCTSSVLVWLSFAHYLWLSPPVGAVCQSICLSIFCFFLLVQGDYVSVPQFLSFPSHFSVLVSVPVLIFSDPLSFCLYLLPFLPLCLHFKALCLSNIFNSSHASNMGSLLRILFYIS